MPPPDWDGPSAAADLRAIATVHAALARDLRRLAASTAPSPAALAAAPVVSRWRVGIRPVPALIGRVDGHPLLPRGPLTSSELVVVDRSRRFARTLSRWYVLGEPAECSTDG